MNNDEFNELKQHELAILADIKKVDAQIKNLKNQKSHLIEEKSQLFSSLDFHCYLVDGHSCIGKADLDKPLSEYVTLEETGVAECFGCGQMVCDACSDNLPYFQYGIKRVCNDCQVENVWKNETMITIKHYVQAGYTISNSTTLKRLIDKMKNLRKNYSFDIWKHLPSEMWD